MSTLKRWGLVFVVLALAVPAAAVAPASEVPERSSTDTPRDQPPTPRYVPGQLIVKLKPGASLEALAQLNQQFRVISVAPLYPKMPDPRERLTALRARLSIIDPADRPALEAQIAAQEALVAQLDLRQQRAPAGLTPPILDTTYVLKVPEATDIPQMAAAYAANPSVEYAEPSRIVHIQRSQP